MFFEKKYFPALLFSIFLLLGLYISKDFGIAWDEPAQRNIGEINYFYLEGKDTASLAQSMDRYHGPAFELALFTIERKLGIKDLKTMYELRHQLSFVMFFIACICFYFLCLNRFKSRLTALAGFLFIVLSPRIFADAFFNSKDIPCLSWNMIALYTFVRFYDKPSVKRALLHGLACGVFIDIRLIGILLPCFTILFFLLDLVIRKEHRNIKSISSLLFFCGFCFLFMVMFWPILWHSPFLELSNAFTQLSHYPWNGALIYMGGVVFAGSLPWHYLPVWILVSVPPLYLLLFAAGIIFLIVQTVRLDRTKFPGWIKDILFLVSFLTPVISVIWFRSSLYDGWRHLYFIYPAFLMTAVLGFHELHELVNQSLPAQKKKIVAGIFNLSVWGGTIFIAGQMICLHPLQNIYFNFLAGKTLKEAKQNFDMDYWGLSYRQGLEYILKNDSNAVININTYDAPGFINTNALTNKERNRLIYTNNIDFADYFITDFRGHPSEYNEFTEFYSVLREGAKVMTVYKTVNKMKEGKRSFSRKFKSDLVNNEQHEYWSHNLMVVPQIDAGSHPLVNLLNDRFPFGSTLTFPMDSTWKNCKDRFLLCSASCNLIKKGTRPYFVLSIFNDKGESYYWQKYLFINDPETDTAKWIHNKVVTQFPSIPFSDGHIQIYFIYDDQHEYMIDDLEFEFFELDKSDAGTKVN